MGRVYGARDRLWQEGHENQCTYVRPEFVLTTCALLFECLGNLTHSRRRGLLSECNYRLRAECSYFGSRIICYRVRILATRLSNAHDWCS